MTEEQLPVPVPPAEPPMNVVLNIEEPMVQLMVQFMVAAMLQQGITELTLTEDLLDQAFRKNIDVIQRPDGAYSFVILRD